MLQDLKIFRAEARRYNVKSVLRYFFSWRNSLKPGATSVRDEQPWITFQVIAFLKSKVKATDKVFEYGGGGSTLFFVNRAAEVVTVEHNDEWFKILSSIIKEKKLTNWKGNFIGAAKTELVSNPDPANPDHYSSDDIPSRGFNYKEYVSAIDSYSDGYFDWVIVDGRSRPACIVHALPKIKRGGYLVLDNSDRDYYLKNLRDFIINNFVIEIDEFGPSPYSRDFTKTSVWRKK